MSGSALHDPEPLTKPCIHNLEPAHDIPADAISIGGIDRSDLNTSPARSIHDIDSVSPGRIPSLVQLPQPHATLAQTIANTIYRYQTRKFIVRFGAIIERSSLISQLRDYLTIT